MEHGGTGVWDLHISPGVLLGREGVDGRAAYAQTVLHEMMHPRIDPKIQAFLRGDTEKLSDADLEALTLLEELRREAREAALRFVMDRDNVTREEAARIVEQDRNMRGVHEANGEGLYEFFTEALNHKEFQDFLSSLRTTTGEGQFSTIWQRVVNLLTRLLTGRNTAMDSVMQRSMEAGLKLATDNGGVFSDRTLQRVFLEGNTLLDFDGRPMKDLETEGNVEYLDYIYQTAGEFRRLRNNERGPEGLREFLGEPSRPDPRLVESLSAAAAENQLRAESAGEPIRASASDPVLTGSQENIPGSNSGLLEKLAAAPYDVRLGYHNKLDAALVDPETGQDAVAEILGIPSPRILATGPSIYAHDGIVEVNPADILTGFQSVDDAVRYMILRGAFTSQNAIAGIDPKDGGKNEAAVFDIGRVPTEEEVLKIYDALTNKDDTALFLNDTGVSLVKLGLEFNGHHTDEMWDATINSVQNLLNVIAGPFDTDTIYHENEYDRTTDTTKDGGFHFQSKALQIGLNTEASARPLDIQTRSADRLRARLAAVNQEFADRGYGNPEPVRGSKLLTDLGLGGATRLSEPAAQQPRGYQGEASGKSTDSSNALRSVRGKPGNEQVGRQFRDGLQRVYDEHPHGKAVTVKDSDFYSDPKTTLFLGGDGLAGVAVTPSGDLVSVFKHPSSTTTKEEMAELLRGAARISKTLDAYDINGYLPTLYSQFGFEPVARMAFNREFAPEGWTYDTLRITPTKWRKWVGLIRSPA